MLHDLNDFLRLSATLNMQLCAAGVGRHNVMAAVLGRTTLSARDAGVLLDVLDYLEAAYGLRRRRVGSLSLLHPLRATALFVRAVNEPVLLDLLTSLLHDKHEDLNPEQVAPDAYWKLERDFQASLKRIDSDCEWLLMERVSWLTRGPEETYFSYIARLMDHAHRAPSLVPIKLADRLDNTLDLRIDIEDPIHGVDFFSTVFEMLFIGGQPGCRTDLPHPPASPVNGAERLYQLFKNAVVLSMVRATSAAQDHAATAALVQALATASMKEAQRIVLHIFAYHEPDAQVQRAVLLEVLENAQANTPSRISFPDCARRLDRLFAFVFEHTDRETRDRNLVGLYANKRLMLEAALSFVVVFLGLLTGHDFPDVSTWRDAPVSQAPESTRQSAG